jgi:hypothetical protein
MKIGFYHESHTELAGSPGKNYNCFLLKEFSGVFRTPFLIFRICNLSYKLPTHMDLAALKHSLSQDEPPANISVYQAALWYAAKGKWDKAHNLVQDLEDQQAALVHAYLHREEGDVFNADYWYRRAGRKRPPISLADEWDEIAKELV